MYRATPNIYIYIYIYHVCIFSRNRRMQTQVIVWTDYWTTLRHSGVHGGAEAPAPLRSELKCPCGPVCAIWTISWMIKISTAAPYMQSTHFAEGTNSRGGTIPVAQKKKKTWRAIPSSAPATARASCLRLNADDHNWWTTMPVKRHQHSGAERKTKKKKVENEAPTSLSGRLHS